MVKVFFKLLKKIKHRHLSRFNSTILIINFIELVLMRFPFPEVFPSIWQRIRISDFKFASWDSSLNSWFKHLVFLIRLKMLTWNLNHKIYPYFVFLFLIYWEQKKRFQKYLCVLYLFISCKPNDVEYFANLEILSPKDLLSIKYTNWAYNLYQWFAWTTNSNSFKQLVICCSVHIPLRSIPRVTLGWYDITVGILVSYLGSLSMNRLVV